MRNLALYRAKSEGRNGYRFFESGMDDDARLRRVLELDLRNAISRNEFELHYQTILNVATRTRVAWRHWFAGAIRSMG